MPGYCSVLAEKEMGQGGAGGQDRGNEKWGDACTVGTQGNTLRGREVWFMVLNTCALELTEALQ